jgi:hypothetical protein
MARFRNNLDKKSLENRKRDLKNLLKAANESLKQRARKGELPPSQTAALNFLTKERVNSAQLSYLVDNRYQHNENIVSFKRPALGKR